MQPKSDGAATSQRTHDAGTSRRSFMATSRIVSRPDELTGGEETEIAAQVSVPNDGCWGWMVVFGAFFNIFILDGVTYTFGSILPDLILDIQQPDSLIALINSIAVALYFLTSPLASALINKYGFRECAMTGSVVCSFSLLICYFLTTYWSLCVFYGIFAGMGYSLINMSSALVVGFYFEKFRAVAMAIATCGSSCGVMIMFPVNSLFVKLAGWRVTTLFHSGLFGLVFFLGMTFKPLVSFTIKRTEEDATKTVTYLPSMMSTSLTPRQSPSHATPLLLPTATERLFKAASNMNFPTAAAVIEEETSVALSSQGTSKLTMSAMQPIGGMSQRQLKHVQSIISKTSTQIPATLVIHKPPSPIERDASSSRRSKSPRNQNNGCWHRLCQQLCHWEPHELSARPMYRDDAFYEGRLESLMAYQKSMLDTKAQDKTGLEYHMTVTRTTAVVDLQERRGVFTTAVRRVLATMMDPSLLHRTSFMLLCCSGFMIYLGFLVPYVYLQDRNIREGIAPKHCSMFVSTIGLSNAFGRLTLGSLAGKLDPLKLFAFWCTVAGLSTIASVISFNVYFQYTYCCIFGFSIACVACLRSISLVTLYGLEKLTNATGMMLIFLGLGNLVSTPLAGVLKNKFGYDVAFIVAGTFITIGGLILIPVRTLAIKESKISDKFSNKHIVGSSKQTGPNLNSKSNKLGSIGT